MDKTIGVIGAGNMATAIVGGIIKSGKYDESQIIISDIDENQRQKIKDKFNVITTADNDEVVSKGDIVLFAVKPQYFADSIRKINKQHLADKLIISIMAGISMKKIGETLKVETQISRVMPNTPAFVGESMSAISFDMNVSEENKNIVIEIFDAIGKTMVIAEEKIDAVTAVSGSSPAYVFMMIEAMADAGVLLGLTRDESYLLASQAILGSAKLFLEGDIHPGKLKDMVCSPAGTTIEAVRVLEQNGFRSALIEAMIACEQKSRDMGKK